MAAPEDRAGAPSANRASNSTVSSVPPGRFAIVNEHRAIERGLSMAAGAGPMGMTDSVYQSLLANRIIFLGSEVRDENANAICAQMLLLNAEDPNRDIFLYINSPGGSVDSGMAIFDTMQWISNDVATVAMGLAASMGQFLLSAGQKGKRFALPHSRIMMHQPSGGLGGTASDIRIQAEQSLHIKKTMSGLIAEHTGQTVEQIEKDSDRDRWFTAEAALAYGFIDHVYERASQIKTADAPNQ
jgi:ATP-dependent Clp protease protease subunit